MKTKFLSRAALQILSLISLAACSPGFSVNTEVAGSLPASMPEGDASGGGGTADTSTPSADGKSGRCQSETLCVHSQMPLWSQSDGGVVGVLKDGKIVQETINVNGAAVALLPYIQSQGYSTVKGDPGWCGAVSFAMVAKSWQKELASRGESLKAGSDVAFFAENDASVIILETMGLLGMRPDFGVSSPLTHEKAFKSMATSSAKGTTETVQRMMTVTEFRETYERPLVTLGIGSAAAGGGHFVALNGTDGQNYIVFDPWGASYTVKSTKGTVEKDGPFGKYFDYSLTYLGSGMKTLTGISSGFIPTYGPTSGVANSIMLRGY